MDKNRSEHSKLEDKKINDETNKNNPIGKKDPNDLGNENTGKLSEPQKKAIQFLKAHKLKDEATLKPIFNVDALWCMYICSVIAACNAEVFTFPLDLIKTRLQIQGEKADKVGGGPKRRMIATGLAIVKEEGVLGLWKGLTSVFARHSIYSGVRLTTYNAIKEYFINKYPDQKSFPLWQGIVCGLASGGFAQLLANPADLIKVQLQMEGKRKMMGLPPRINGFMDAFFKIYQAGGIRGLYKGCVPSVQRAALVTLGDVTVYDMSKRFIQKHTDLPDAWVLHTLSSTTAGFAGSTLSTPADVIKSRVMNQPTDERGKGLLYKGSLDCLTKAVRDEGVFALYKGFLPTWIRLGPWATIYWITYEQIRILIGAKSF